MSKLVEIFAEPINFTALPPGWKCVSAVWGAGKAKNDGEIMEFPAIGVSVVHERRCAVGSDDRGEIVGTHLEFVIVTGDGLELWGDYIDVSNVVEVGFLSPTDKLETVFPREKLGEMIEEAREKANEYRIRSRAEKKPCPTSAPSN